MAANTPDENNLSAAPVKGTVAGVGVTERDTDPVPVATTTGAIPVATTGVSSVGTPSDSVPGTASGGVSTMGTGVETAVRIVDCGGTEKSEGTAVCSHPGQIVTVEVTTKVEVELVVRRLVTPPVTVV